MDNVDITPIHYPLNYDAAGRIKIWRFDQETGDKELLVDKPNLIVRQGASIMASALAGQPNSGISHFYIGYNTDIGFNDQPAAALTDTCASFSSVAPYGYLRLPLAFPPSFLAETNYSLNVPYFTTFITAASGAYQNGATFGNNVRLFSLGLVNAQNPSGDNQDRLFSKVSFGPITFNSTQGLAITWGVTFRAATPA